MFNGSRFETYVISGEPNSGVVCLNGAAARCVQPQDKIIIMSYCQMSEEEAKEYQPVVVFVDEGNTIDKVTNYERNE